MCVLNNLTQIIQSCKCIYIPRFTPKLQDEAIILLKDEVDQASKHQFIQFAKVVQACLYFLELHKTLQISRTTFTVCEANIPRGTNVAWQDQFDTNGFTRHTRAL